jgi:hypothetical protein
MGYRTGNAKASRLIGMALGLVLVISTVSSQVMAVVDFVPFPAQASATDELESDSPIKSVPSPAGQTGDLWVDATDGNDANDGRTPTSAFHTIQKAADLADPGTTVHILTGVYRETVWPAQDGTAAEPVLYLAENGPGTVAIRGSESASSLVWTQLTADTIGLPPGVNPANIYYADLSFWELDDPPRFVVELDGKGEVVARLPMAREPDWQVVNEWKYHEFWWAADGGSDVASCDPPTDPDPEYCDRHSRSATQLTDRTDDSAPSGIELGNLTTLGDLTGGTMVAIDTSQGHYVYRRDVVSHNISAGRITVGESCELDAGSGNPGLGWGSKYYVEGKPYLLDTPGEWWYDQDSGYLYLWPRAAGNPAAVNIEIARRSIGFRLDKRSYITLDSLTLEFFADSVIYQSNSGNAKSYDNTVRNTTLRYANRGVVLNQGADGPADNITDGFTLENSEIAYMDTHAIYLSYWWKDGSAINSFTHAGIVNTIIRNNEFHHLGFRTDYENAVGASFLHPDKLRFEGNHVHHVAHNGMQFSKSIIQSSREYDFAPQEIKTGEILIKDNIFEKACQLTTDCGALKFWGDPPDRHVFRDVLITGNVFRNTFGWTHVAEKRGYWTAGSVRGMGGFGLNVDMASGIHAYRNIAYNNAQAGFKMSGVWRDGDIVYYNNVAANCLYGFLLGASSYDTHGSVNTQIINNIVLNNEGYGILMRDGDGVYTNMDLDHNLYYGNGWGDALYRPGAMSIEIRDVGNKYYQTLAEIQANTPWEDHGVAGDPRFADYDLADHDRHDDSWPDFHLTASSNNAIDRGTAALASSLTASLDQFDVEDGRQGPNYDIGRYETGYALEATPPSGATQPGVATYVLSLVPASAETTFSLTMSSPPSDVLVEWSSQTIPPGGTATLTMRSTSSEPKLPGEWHTMTITATDSILTLSTTVDLLVGGARTYLPVAVK